MINDPISDMLTRLRNGLMAGKKEVVVPFSKIKLNIAKILAEEGLISAMEKEEGRFGGIKIILKYANSQPAINSLKRISTPGRRIYVNKNNLPNVRNGLGLAVISTSSGLMTNRQAKKKGLGGEVICEID